MNEAMPAKGDALPEGARREVLFGKERLIKGFACAENGGEYRPKAWPAKVQLSIQLTRFCPAACPFCIAAPTSDPAYIRPETLYKCLKKCREENRVRGISITGGEPFYYFELLKESIAMIFELFGLGMEISITTNGMALDRLSEITQLKYIDALHISRHHWDDRLNDRAFAHPMPTAAWLKECVSAVEHRRIFVLNCMLLKGFVESREDVHRYMDFAIGLDVTKTAFITGAAVNRWIADRQVTFDSVLKDDDKQLLFTREYRDFAYCRCRDGVYVSPEGRLIEFYGRCPSTVECPYIRGMVITPDGMIRANYAGEILFDANE